MLEEYLRAPRSRRPVGELTRSLVPAVDPIDCLPSDTRSPRSHPRQSRSPSGLGGNREDDPQMCQPMRGGGTQQPASPAAARARRERPRDRAAEKRDERATLHSITLSARASSVAGTSMPSALAVLRLRIVSYLVGASTGRSVGFSPFS